MTYYPPVAFSFTAGIADDRSDVVASFQEVSGLNNDNELTELREGDENRFAHRLPERAKASNLVLKRGMIVATSDLFNWLKECLESDLSKPIQPKTITVSLLDQKQTPIMSWSAVNAWPTRWNAMPMTSQDNSVAVETLEFAYTQISRIVRGEIQN